MHVSIRMDPAFDHRRARGGDDFFKSERGIVTLNHVEQSAVAQSFVPPGMKAEGLTVVFAGEERGARLFLRGVDGRMNAILYGQPAEGVPSRFALSSGARTVAISRKAVESLQASPDARTREAVQRFLGWVDGA